MAGMPEPTAPTTTHDTTVYEPENTPGPFDELIPGWPFPLDCHPFAWPDHKVRDEFSGRDVYRFEESFMSGPGFIVPERTLVYSADSPPGLFVVVDEGNSGDPPLAPGVPVDPESVWPRYRSEWLLFKDVGIPVEALHRKHSSYVDGTTNLVIEIMAQERILQNSTRHPNMPEYLGCEVECGWVRGVVFKRYPQNLAQAVANGEQLNIPNIMNGLKAALDYLHSLSLAHNDVNPYNIMLSDDKSAILIDYDACMPVGEPLLDKRGTYGFNDNGSWTVSAFSNDLYGLRVVESYLSEHAEKARTN